MKNPSGLFAHATGMVNQQLLLQDEYLVAKNTILRAHLQSRLLLTDPQQSALANIPTNTVLGLVD